MKFKLKRVQAPWRALSKFLLIMKLSIIILVMSLVQVSAKSYGQLINLHEKNISVHKVLQIIENKTGYHFIYDDNLDALLKAKTLNINVEKRSVTEVLDLCLKDIPVSYQIIQNTIALKRREQLQNEKAAATIQKISGTVTDEKGQPLVGANITNKNTNVTVIADANGSFSINASEGDVLVLSFIGYQRTEYKITHAVLDKGERLTIKLQPSAAALEEIVVVSVGYGKQKKELLTASVSTVSGSELVKAPVSNLSTALKGQLSGLTAMQSTGKPGSDGSVLTIRGIGTYTGQTAPLIMVDGIARDAFDDIDPNEVASISILKDASATAVFGVRGANGVILVTTKRGKQGPPSINLTSQTAFSSFTNFPSFANSYDYATVVNERAMQEYWIKHAKDPDIHTWDDFVAKRDANWRNDGSLCFTDN